MQQPQVIFLDAVGTLFGVRNSVGEVYGQLARRVGVEVEALPLNQAFIQSFQAAPRAVFPGVAAADLPSYEFRWWQAIAAQSFERVGALHQFSDFPRFFSDLYAHFATAEPWIVYADVRPMLKYWQTVGIQLGVISNFDRRLYSVLEALDLAPFFTSITISTEAGAAKPDPQIFGAALEKHGGRALHAWHIGDSLRDDY
ncbi:MAG TPA: HAD-IA family hydrolase, partial [Candidatus Caenarcaniphilales bacterium]